MDIKIEHAQFVPDPALWVRFTESPDGEVGSDLRNRGRKLVLLAQRSVQKRSGELARSINMQYFPVKNPFVRVGSENEHALMMHNGTKPHWIGPEHQEVLRFRIKGKVVYTRRVFHPGTRGSFYLTRHLRKVV